MKRIPFKQWEVQALAEGRLSAIVRMVKPQFTTDRVYSWMVDSRNKFGRPGERFFVGETWAPHVSESDDGLNHWFKYRAIGSSPGAFGWRPSTTMPAIAARFRPLIESVHVVRIRELTERERCDAFGLSPITRDYKEPRAHAQFNADNGPGAYELNPFVWFVKFRVEPQPSPGCRSLNSRSRSHETEAIGVCEWNCQGKLGRI